MSPDQLKLAAWLRERQLDQRLGEHKAESEQETPLLYELSRPTSSLFKPGDVVILRPSHKTIQHGPVYGLLLASADEDSWRFVPFSRYQHAAVPGEWATHHHSVLLRVLCFWNARSVFSMDCLPKRAAHFMGTHVTEVNDAHDAFVSGVSSTSDRFGPPLIHPADPRYEYLDEERERVDLHVQPRLSNESGQQPRNAWLLAAEGRPGYGKREL